MSLYQDMMKTQRPSAVLTLLALLAPSVVAHGFVDFLMVDNALYYGSNGANASSSSPLCKVSTGSPVTNVSSQDIVCGPSAIPAPETVSANPGSLLQFFWRGETGGDWLHNTGKQHSQPTS